ncbi:Uncharacterised protein [Mycobacteroides abscessus subsp. abscessus]|nr:Uncharacterised protein [Mycobacteroides abscessus subsp. abscessus]
MWNARPVRQSRDVTPVLTLGKSSGQVGVVQIAQHECDAEGGQHGTEDIVGRNLDDADHQAGKGQHVDENVESEPEEGVGIPSGPPR